MYGYNRVAVIVNEDSMITVMWYKLITTVDADGKTVHQGYYAPRIFNIRIINTMIKKYCNDVDREFKNRHKNENYEKWLKS
jgi:hypothetical protein